MFLLNSGFLSNNYFCLLGSPGVPGSPGQFLHVPIHVENWSNSKNTF